MYDESFISMNEWSSQSFWLALANKSGTESSKYKIDLISHYYKSNHRVLWSLVQNYCYSIKGQDVNNNLQDLLQISSKSVLTSICCRGSSNNSWKLEFLITSRKSNSKVIEPDGWNEKCLLWIFVKEFRGCEFFHG